MDNTQQKAGSAKGSYFVRHTRGVKVRRSDLERLWKQNRIAIHFPGDTVINDRDIESLDPSHYSTPNERGAIGAFAELAECGGYVWAQSYVSDRIKIGYVRGRVDGGGESMDRGARWALGRGEFPGREDDNPATLKTLQMKRVKELSRGEAMHLRAARPRGVAICRWKIVGSRLRDLVDDNDPEPEWSSLSVAEQEAACAEFLRERHPDRQDLPVLSRLLLPVGRTLEDVDIYGLTTDGSRLYAQVTHHTEGSKAAEKKARRLREYLDSAGDRVDLVSFCRGSALESDQSSTRFVSVDEEVLPWIATQGFYWELLLGVGVHDL